MSCFSRVETISPHYLRNSLDKDNFSRAYCLPDRSADWTAHWTADPHLTCRSKYRNKDCQCNFLNSKLLRLNSYFDLLFIKRSLALLPVCSNNWRSVTLLWSGRLYLHCHQSSSAAATAHEWQRKSCWRQCNSVSWIRKIDESLKHFTNQRLIQEQLT